MLSKGLVFLGDAGKGYLKGKVQNIIRLWNVRLNLGG